MKNTELISVFSLVTGKVDSYERDEIKNLNDYHVPLCRPFSSSCNKCYGRGYIGTYLEPGLREHTDILVLCPKCMKRCVDVELTREILKEQKINARAFPNEESTETATEGNSGAVIESN